LFDFVFLLLLLFFTTDCMAKFKTDAAATSWHAHAVNNFEKIVLLPLPVAGMSLFIATVS